METRKVKVTEGSQATQQGHHHLLVISCDEKEQCCKVYPEILRIHQGDTVVIIARNTDATVTIQNASDLSTNIGPLSIKDFRNGGLSNAVSLPIKSSAAKKEYPYVFTCTDCKDCPPGGPRMIVE